MNQQREARLGREYVEVEAPFDMPRIQIPDFGDCQRRSILEFGAKAADRPATTRAIATAIADANAAGGGVVEVPEGDWLCSGVRFKSNVCLHLQRGARLIFSGNPDDYLPAVPSSWEGFECLNYRPLIYAYECENVAISGEGALVAEMEVWEEWFARPPAHMEGLKRLYEMGSKDWPLEKRDMTQGDANLRPQFVQFNRCRHVLIEGVSIENSPFWVLHPFLCEDVVIRRVSVKAHGHNNDGVDPEMCQNLLIEDCVFDQGDDAIAIKSGRNRDAWRIGVPTRNVVIRNCHVKNAHQLLAVGTELSAGVENVLVENCSLDKSIGEVGHLLYIKTNERRGGWVRKVWMRNIEAGDLRKGVLAIDTDVLFQWRDLVPTYEKRMTRIESVRVENIKVGEVGYVYRILGDERLPVADVRMSGIEYESAREANEVRNAQAVDCPE
ncbi:glycoside hydrolase family 28 protein [Pelagicoccus sp. SDUM812005]|uniref:glycoside hydrolase family 28 protein n=1 Tax=Pelagicoccus sp. SDUM812005 TaxID=3041257 RepID=UPI00280D1BEC|nr:glycoside hydrolase family 28 protein [Pelagicoccus sp. SDUM812005]MDQ8181011.1 glycoside hydrolase family 28 protein [Pelagicoccus sp. SDUM812005]